MGLPFVARVAGGIVLVALVVGIGLFAERQTDDDLALPDEVGGIAVNESAKVQDYARATSAGLSEVYDDADAVAAVYGKNTKTGLLVTAVRAESGPLVPPVPSESEHWIEDGDVTCLVTPAPKGPGSTQCQRVDGELTVRVVVRGKAETDDLVDATNEVWEDLT
jgi:hypothetical protein